MLCRRKTLTEMILKCLYEGPEIFHHYYTLKRAVYPDYYQIQKALKKKINHKKFVQTLGYLRREGFIRTKIRKEKRIFLLTSKGFNRVFESNLKYIDLKKRNDGKCQMVMVIFDIPEDYRKIRNKFRSVLKSLGYKQLQKSVWISPYDVLKETKEMIKFYKIKNYTKLFLVKTI